MSDNELQKSHSGLENRSTGNGTQGSNPCLSAHETLIFPRSCWGFQGFLRWWPAPFQCHLLPLRDQKSHLRAAIKVLGPYKGKGSAELALLRQMLWPLMAGNVFVFDRYSCSFMMIAQLLNQRLDVCAAQHHLRRTDFPKGRRIGKFEKSSRGLGRPARDGWTSKDNKAAARVCELRLLRQRLERRKTCVFRIPKTSLQISFHDRLTRH